jgi:periplasmic protein TonB
MQRPASQIFQASLSNFVWRCVMPLDPECVPRQSLGSLQSCLVEGDPEQSARERRVRRKALVSSVLLQASLLGALILVPLFAKPAHLERPIVTPIPPYRQAAARAENTTRPRTEVRQICVVCFNPRPAPLTAASRSESNQPRDPFANSPTNGLAMIPCATGSGCIDIRAEGPRPPVTNEARRDKPRILHPGHIDPAMLIHRVEPVYPTLARQTRRSGRVELRAVIATDGTIQSLQVVSGDPLFYQSAMDAVRQWRYKPTVLNGEPVEIDTFISVIYNVGG